MLGLERRQLEGSNPSSVFPTGTGETRVLGGTDARGVSTPVSGLRLAAGAKAGHGAAALVGAGTHCCCARGHQGPGSSTAPFPLAHVHPASTLLLLEANFLSIPINPSADVSRTALKVDLQKSSNSETCRGAAKAPRSPALITANG